MEQTFSIVAKFWMIVRYSQLTLQMDMEDLDGACDEGGNRSSPAPEEPPGILQLIDQLENIVDKLLPG